MPPRRQRMITALQLRGLSERTQEMDVRAVRQRAEHDPTSPERMTEAARCDACLSVKNGQPSSRRARTLARCGLPFFDAPTRQRAWTTRPFVRPPQAHPRPVIRRQEAGHTLLQGGRVPRSRPCLRPLSTCGLRLQEGPHLPGLERERARRGLHVRHGSGAQDREVPLPLLPLALLRPLLAHPPPPRVAWSGARPSGPWEGHSLHPHMPRHRGQDALRAALRASGLPTHA
jgi:integrase/recombinase XerD